MRGIKDFTICLINFIGDDYGTALGCATYSGHVELVSMLLERGADINLVGGEYGAVLHSRVTGPLYQYS